VAVYERTYRRYVGELSPERTRFLVFQRYAFEEVFRSKLFIAFLGLCLLHPFALACILYIPHNLGFLEAFQLDPEQVAGFFNFDASFFYNWVIWPLTGLAFILTFIVGPALVSSDLRNNGLALYFSRPVTRTEYVFGKLAVLTILLSAITWIPGLLLFFFQSYLEGVDWLQANYRVGIGIFLGFWIWIAVLGLISLALSAYVKWRPVARMSMILVFIVLAGMSAMINGMFRTNWASVINVTDMYHVVVAWLFGVKAFVDTPVWAAWLSLLGFCGICVLLLARKLKPYEVVR